MTPSLTNLCKYLREHCDENVPLAQMSRIAHMSPYHLHRQFKAALGLTPKQYLDACRMEAFKNGLRQAGSVTEAVYGAGYGSSSRLYENVDAHLGMTPAQFRALGRGVSLSFTQWQTPFGLLQIAATDRGLCSVEFGEDASELRQRLDKLFARAERTEVEGEPGGALAEWKRAFDGYLLRGTPLVGLPLDVQASVFQAKVWRYLQSIPGGQTRSYSEVATAIGHPSASRAVARACASNPVALCIPCHRVIRSTGEAGGYRWGLERKAQILEQERQWASTAELV
jgi:AraC family transcriptional regulator, regulatory protein of adaptative response / methylated-DNA-[protein]-cysteine methyltransferase